jgi:hypothetical protein
MTLNVAQYLAPLNSGQVLNGYVQGVKEGTGITISPDGTISLNPSGASTLGFITSSVTPAPIYAWPAIGATQPAGGVLQTDGLGNLAWNAAYVSVVPANSTFPHTGAAAMPVGVSGLRPSPATKGLFRYNDSTNAFEFSNGSAWLPVTPATGSVFSFVSNVTPTPNAIGDLWLDTNTNQEKVWDGISWVPTSPLATSTVPGLVKIGSNIQVAGDGTISVLSTIGVSGLVSNLGVTTITDNVTSTSIDSALSANQGRLLQEQINSLLIANNLTLAGLISGSGVMTYVTPEGALQGFTLGLSLPVASVSNEGYFVIVDSAGGFTPPGGSFTVVTQGDWFSSTGTTWQFLNVGYDPPIATTTQFGITRLSTDLETQIGTSNAIAVTPASLSSRVATETRTGITEIATQAEANAGVNDFAYLTPLKLFGVLSSGSVNANNILLSPNINGNTNVQSALNDAIYDVISSNSSLTVSETAVGQVDIVVTQATETQIGGAEIATQIETNAGTDDLRIVTPLKLSQFIASGNIEASEIPLNPAINGYTNVQQALSNGLYDIVSPASTLSITENPTGLIDIDVVQATEGQLGGAEIATNAETQALASDSVVVTPLKLGNLFASGAIDANDILLNPAINGNTNVQNALADAIYDVVSANASLTVSIAPTGLVTLTSQPATTALAGVVELATVAEVLAGTSTALATTPDGVRQATVYKSDFNAKGDILSASANDTPSILSVGTDGQYLRADSAQTAGLVWDTIQATDVAVSPAINGNTNVQNALADAVYDITSTGLTLGITITPSGRFNLDVVQATTTQIGGATLATTAEALAGTNTTNIITPDTMRTATVYKSDFNAKGDLLSASANDTPAILSAGANGQFLIVDSTQATGLAWSTLNASAILVSPAINGNTSLQTVLQDAVYDINSADGSIAITETPTGINDIVVTQATETQLGGGEIATQAETDAGLSDTVLLTPKKLAGYISSGQITASEVVVSPAINGNANVQAALTDAVYDINSANNSITVTETATGINDIIVAQATETLIAGAEIATQVETEAGIDDARIVTPLKLRTAAVYKSDFNAKGDILSASTSDTPLILPVGTNAQYLVVDNTTPTGLNWFTLPTTVGVAGLVSNAGITTITDNLTSTSIDSALSANQGKLLQDQIDALVITNNLTFAGTLNSAGVLTYVTTEGAANGFVAGSTLPVSTAGNAEFFVICEQAGTITPPGGTPTVVTQGDWFVSTGTGWQFLNVGFDVAYATTTQPGIVELATDAETQAGTDTLRVLTPSNLTSRTATETRTGIAELATQIETEAGTDDTRIVTPLKLRTSAVYKSDFNAKGDILSSTANDTPSILPIGANGQVLTVDLTQPTGLKWGTPGVAAFYNLDDISGSFNGATLTFNLTIGGVAYAPSPTSNIMVFIGGIAQTPGATGAYTITGSTITFTSAPPSGATFYANTVR